jgi:hypothetical protein
MTAVLTHLELSPVGCVLGCVCATTGQPWPAADYQLACERCADRLRELLASIQQAVELLADPECLLPTSGTARGTHGFGPHSPAVDAKLAHLDVRTEWTPEAGFGALAAIESWARMLREETQSAPPSGRATIGRELGTIRFHWPVVLRSPWLDEFAGEMRQVWAQLQRTHGWLEPVVRVGACPTELVGPTVDGSPLVCGAPLRVRPGAGEIACQRCGDVRSRPRWSELADPWTDYAELHEALGVAVGTLWRWCSEDRWRTSGTRSRRLVARADALASFQRRRGGSAA